MCIIINVILGCFGSLPFLIHSALCKLSNYHIRENQNIHIPNAELSLQALVPVAFQIVFAVTRLLQKNQRTDMISNIYLMIAIWENTLHPFICYIYVKPIRSALKELFNKPFCFLNFKKKVYPKNLQNNAPVSSDSC